MQLDNCIKKKTILYIVDRAGNNINWINADENLCEWVAIVKLIQLF